MTHLELMPGNKRVSPQTLDVNKVTRYLFVAALRNFQPTSTDRANYLSIED